MVDYSNPKGCVQILDGGIPRTITIKAREDISGGYWVNGSSAQGVVGSESSSYVAGDIEGNTVKNQIGSQIIGLAISNIASGTYGTIAQRGMYIMPALSGTAIGSIYSGQKICAGSAGTVLPLYSGLAMPLADAAAAFNSFDVGRSMTDGPDAAPGYVIVSLNI